MSSYSKIAKNAEKYRLEQFCNQMTPEQYKQTLKTAVKAATENLALEYDRQLAKIEQEKENKICSLIHVINVEILYEIASQMDCFVKNPEILDQKREKILEIYENSRKAIMGYIENKYPEKSLKEFCNKKNQLEKLLKIKI